MAVFGSKPVRKVWVSFRLIEITPLTPSNMPYQVISG